MPQYEVRLTEEALAMLEEIQDRRERKVIWNKIQGLKDDPDKKGKALVNELAGCRTIRVVGQRYRIIYKVIREEVQVVVVGTGIRKDGDKHDIYERLKRVFR